MMISQILKIVDFTKLQNFRYCKNKTLIFLQIKKIINYHYKSLKNIKGYFMAKNTFVVEVTINYQAIGIHLEEAFLAIKIKRYLHILYMQLVDYLHIYNIDNILKYTENENLKP